MAVWTDFIGIFEDKGGWVAGADPDLIDIADFVAHGTDYLILQCETWGFVLNPDLALKDLPDKLTGSFGIGKQRHTLDLNCMVRDDNTYVAEENLNFVTNFVGTHRKSTNPVAYLVIRKLKAATYRYLTFNNAAEVQLKYLKGKAGPVKGRKTKLKNIKFTMTFTEVLL